LNVGATIFEKQRAGHSFSADGGLVHLAKARIQSGQFTGPMSGRPAIEPGEVNEWLWGRFVGAASCRVSIMVRLVKCGTFEATKEMITMPTRNRWKGVFLALTFLLFPCLILFAQPPGNGKSSAEKNQYQGPAGLEKSKLRPREGKLQVGDAVPNLQVWDIDGKKEVDLRALSNKPTVLIFGSCT
jgi:hypothetical protein